MTCKLLGFTAQHATFGLALSHDAKAVQKSFTLQPLRKTVVYVS